MTQSRRHGIIGVVLVSYNSEAELAPCIASIRVAAQHAHLVPHIVVVDNNSKDGSVQLAQGAADTVLENATNRGFAAAVNQGLRDLKPVQPTWIMLLNPDTTLAPDAIKQLVRCLHDNPQAGAVGARLIDPHTAGATEYYLRPPNVATVALYATFLRPLALKSSWLTDHLYLVPIGSTVQPMPLLAGACIVTTSAVLADVGPLDEDYAIWFEDVDWSYRARKKNYQLLCDPSAVVYHAGGISFNKWNSPQKNLTFYISMKTFFKKQKPIQLPFVLFILCSNAFLVWLKNHDRSYLRFIPGILTKQRGNLPE